MTEEDTFEADSFYIEKYTPVSSIYKSFSECHTGMNHFSSDDYR